MLYRRRLIIKNDEKPDYNRAPSNQRGRGGYANNGAPRRPQSNPNQLFVGNLPWSTTWQDLKDIAKDNGFNPVRADVAMSYDGKSRGWGTLAFETEDEAKRAQGNFPL
jgi:RNA recognition motif-containing protein